MAVTIDEMLEKIGMLRQYQWYVTIVLGYCILASGAFSTMIVSFITAEPDWKCVDGYMNNTVCRFNKSITLTSDDYKARCKMPRQAWTYVDDFTSTVTEYDLVCDDSILQSIAQSCFWIGMFIGLLIGGYSSDKFGRRKICSSGTAIGVVATLIVVFPKSFPLFIICRIFIGFGGGLAGSCTFSLLTELTTEKYHSWIGMGYFMFWTVGLMTLPLIGYFEREWRMFLLITAVCAAPCLMLIWLIPESPRWLLIHNKEKEARTQLLKIAKMNKKALPNEELEKPVVLEKHLSFKQLFSSWKLAKTTFICCDLWFSVSLVYYGVAYGSVDLGGNRYLNFFLVSLVGLPATLVTALVVNRIGRKTCVVCSFVITIVASAVSISIPADRSSASVGGRVAAAIIARFFVSTAFNGCYIWTSELYPTVIRATAMSTSSSAARIGSFAASYIIWLIRIHAALPYSIMGVICLQAAVLGLFLPETKGKSTLETMDDMKKQNRIALVVNADGTDEKNELEKCLTSEPGT